jgi:hypothetical protein
MIERNITNENQQHKNIDANSYIIVKSQNFISSLKDEENKHFLGSKNCIREESYNNIYDSNFNNVDFNNTHNILHSHLNEENKSHHLTESIPTEELFLKQKEKIKIYKEKNKKIKDINLNLRLDNLNSNKSIDLLNSKNSNKLINNNNIGNGKVYIHQKKIFNGTFKTLTLENYQFFENTYFQSKRKHSCKEDNIPILKNAQWKSLNNPLNNIELKKMALRTINEINYETNMIEINANFILEGESEFWIFTRCFVNKDINESINFDISSVNNEPDIVFNKYSSLIKIIKERYSNKCFVTFGTFCENSKDPNQISYKTFLKRQLVNFNENNNFKYLENDICEFNVNITDNGSENIEAKISMNSDNKYNSIIGNFYLPTNKRSKILFCGEGQSIILKRLTIHNFDKNEQIHQFETLFSFDQKSCTCCNIY